MRGSTNCCFKCKSPTTSVFMSPPRIPSAIRAPTSAEPRVQKASTATSLAVLVLNFGHSMPNEAMPMQIAGPSNRVTPPLHIVLPTCLRPFRTTIRNRPATQAAAQAIEPVRLLLLSERRGTISRCRKHQPRVDMSILLASIQITTSTSASPPIIEHLLNPFEQRKSPGGLVKKSV